MNIHNTESLGLAVDRLNEAFFFGRNIPSSEAKEAARWIASRQGLLRAYAGTFALTDAERTVGIRVFTGERMNCASARHIIGEESMRVLTLLSLRDRVVAEALARARAGMEERLAEHHARGFTPGMYCCGKCSVAYWRNLAVGGLSNAERLLAAGMKDLKRHRKGECEWRRFPFYYTLLALTEIDVPGAVGEVRYAAPLCESRLKRVRGGDLYAIRRRAVMERALSKC